MEQEITFSRDYHQLWKDAWKRQNLDQLDLIFHSLCSEIGLQDEAAQSARSEAGTKSAQNRNDHSSEGVPGKKV